ncbi:uncharacterized protein LOC131040127 [Cryptomeria japonica]|uniref:uncharacterized protein LOC131040127 n=1 Tax=Cryptomeria japonica TaxID=3369 RepID=UPI0025AC5FFE|nr:uncharacterized protein LOC131040127 [Cryptomeria japonica]
MSLASSRASKTHLSLKFLVTAMILPSSQSHLNSRFHDTCTASMDINFDAINQELICTRVKAYGYKLDSCINTKSFAQGKQTHGHMLVSGVVIDAYLGTKLINLYANCGAFMDARLVFNKLKKKRNPILWNSMIKGYILQEYCEEGFALYDEMQSMGMQPDNFTFPFVLKACGSLIDLKRGKEVHSKIVKMGLDYNVYVGSALVDMYAKCQSLKDARQIFDKMSERNVVSWTAMISGYAQNEQGDEALTLFREMQAERVETNLVTIVSVLPAAAVFGRGTLQQGREIHGYVIRNELDSQLTVLNALLDMYAKSGNTQCARHVFDKMFERNVVSWTAMISGYAQNEQSEEALSLFRKMQIERVETNSVTIVSVLPAVAVSGIGTLQQGREIHGYVIRNEFDSQLNVSNALLDMYAKCGSIQCAGRVFDKMSQRNVVSYNAMLAGYVQNGYADKALKIFHQMSLEDVECDSVTITSILRACACLTALEQGKDIHNYTIKKGFGSSVSVGNALIDMYSKGGGIDYARNVFDEMAERNVISWTAIIAGYGLHGQGKDALKLFDTMQQIGLEPNHITFVAVLSACSHAGLVDKGQEYFGSMSCDYKIAPRVEHYACMVDLLGRAGRLEEAYDIIKNMPMAPDAAVWGALLGACTVYSNTELGRLAAEQVIELMPINSGFYVLLSHIYAKAGKWDDVAKVRTLMKESGVKKSPGRSWIAIKNNVHTFVAGDRSHPESEMIYAVLESLSKQIKDIGYTPDIQSVLHDLGEDEKECALTNHSEKLAIAFGLIKTSPETTIRVAKNLRVCCDCHIAIKFISIVVGREIIVRDTNRFHHFKDGHCSCGDYCKATLTRVLTFNIVKNYQQKTNNIKRDDVGKKNNNPKVDSNKHSQRSPVQKEFEYSTSDAHIRVIYRYMKDMIMVNMLSLTINGTFLIFIAYCALPVLFILSATMSLALPLARKTHLSLKSLVTATASSSQMHLNYLFLCISTVSKDINSHTITQELISSRVEAYGYILDSCINEKALAQGKQIHSHMLVSGIVINAFLGTKLINLYANCGAFMHARLIFDKLKTKRNPILWNSMIKEYVLQDFCEEGFALYDEMQKMGLQPDKFTFPFVLKACGSLVDLKRGKEVHSNIIRIGLNNNVYVDSALVDMYAKCQSFGDARRVFDKMTERNVVSWTAMISGYAQNEKGEEALSLFRKMQMQCVETNPITIVSVLPATAVFGIEFLKQGREIHGYVIRNEFDSQPSVSNALLDMYAKCGSIECARHVFDKMCQRDVVSYNAMLAGYMQNGCADKALKIFHQMPFEDVGCDSVTITSVLRACACLTSLEQGMGNHNYATKKGFVSSVSVGNALIDMYAKCGSIDYARNVFDEMAERNAISWTAIIAGYGLHGQGEEALKLFDTMQQIGPEPNHITFVAVLSACSHAGLVDKGQQYFGCMSHDYEAAPRVEHYACMVDLLGRAGRLEEAYDIIKNMPIAPDAAVWGALLGACRIYCNTKLGKLAAEKVIELMPRNAGFYVLLSNIYAKTGKWDEVAKVRKLMKENGIIKSPGHSWITIKDTVHTFVVGDRSHPETAMIYAVLESLSKQIKDIGYTPDIHSVLHDLGQDEKECALTNHSEKLAIAFGLIKTCPGTTIRIAKNLRVCCDCHTAIKFISIVVGREIIVRDANRFHHFKNGHCSCGDYW